MLPINWTGRWCQSLILSLILCAGSVGCDVKKSNSGASAVTTLPQIAAIVGEEQKLAIIPDSVHVLHITFSRNGRTVAYTCNDRASDEPQSYMVVNGIVSKGYQGGIFKPVVNGDGSIVAYRARPTKWGNDHIVLNGKRIDRNDYVTCGDPIIWPDDKTMSFTAWSNRDGAAIVVDGEERLTKDFDTIESHVVSSTCKLIAFRATKNAREVIVVGRDESPHYDIAGDPAFSPDGGSIAYGAKLNKVEFVVVGGKRGPEWDEVGPTCRRRGQTPPVHSPEGSVIAYPARTGEKWFMVCDGKVGPSYDYVEPATFSAKSSFVYRVTIGKKKAISVADRCGPHYEDVSLPAISGDGTAFAYAAKMDGKWSVVINDQLQPGVFEAISHLSLSTDGKRIAFAVKEGTNYRVIAGQAKSQLLDGIYGDIQLTPDGEKAAFGACIRNELWWKTLTTK